MRIDGLFTNNELGVPTLRRRSIAGWRKTLTAAMLLASAPGICLAQWFDTGGAFLPSPVRTASTVPPNGDVNPYGVAFVPNNFMTGSGKLRLGDILISNFNNSANI